MNALSLNPHIYFGPQWGHTVEFYVDSKENIFDMRKYVEKETPIGLGDRFSKMMPHRAGLRMHMFTGGSCRALLGNEVRRCIQDLQDMMVKKNKKPSGISLTRGAWLGMGQLGIWQQADDGIFNKDQLEVLKSETYLHLLDLLVANTMLMISDKAIYGAAGQYEYKEKIRPFPVTHSKTTYNLLEYQTLSNLWFKSYPLMSFVCGLARLAGRIAFPVNKAVSDAFFTAVPREQVIKTLQDKDCDQATANFNKIIPILSQIFPHEKNSLIGNTSISLHSRSIPVFQYFVKKGLDHWFPRNPLEHWYNLGDGHGIGWEAFLQNVVLPQMPKKA